mmetsp:Transcript_27072/g.51172  ORF Transcript_27072/g.51172 Transcript_27072/m.51172 type:complete len:476 (-) Transcript_27072:703-2130(-)
MVLHRLIDMSTSEITPTTITRQTVLCTILSRQPQAKSLIAIPLAHWKVPHRPPSSSIDRVPLYLVAEHIRGPKVNRPLLRMIFYELLEVVVDNMATAPPPEGAFVQEVHLVIAHFVVGNHHWARARETSLGVVFGDVDGSTIGGLGLIGDAGQHPVQIVQTHGRHNIHLPLLLQPLQKLQLLLLQHLNHPLPQVKLLPSILLRKHHQHVLPLLLQRIHHMHELMHIHPPPTVVRDVRAVDDCGVWLSVPTVEPLGKFRQYPCRLLRLLSIVGRRPSLGRETGRVLDRLLPRHDQEGVVDVFALGVFDGDETERGVGRGTPCGGIVDCHAVGDQCSFVEEGGYRGFHRCRCRCAQCRLFAPLREPIPQHPRRRLLDVQHVLRHLRDQRIHQFRTARSPRTTNAAATTDLLSLVVVVPQILRADDAFRILPKIPVFRHCRNEIGIRPSIHLHPRRRSHLVIQTQCRSDFTLGTVQLQ